MKSSKYTIGSRSRDLSVCSALVSRFGASVTYDSLRRDGIVVYSTDCVADFKIASNRLVSQEVLYCMELVSKQVIKYVSK
jgi:hypothetical protein